MKARLRVAAILLALVQVGCAEDAASKAQRAEQLDTAASALEGCINSNAINMDDGATDPSTIANSVYYVCFSKNNAYLELVTQGQSIWYKEGLYPAFRESQKALICASILESRKTGLWKMIRVRGSGS